MSLVNEYECKHTDHPKAVKIRIAWWVAASSTRAPRSGGKLGDGLSANEKAFDNKRDIMLPC